MGVTEQADAASRTRSKLAAATTGPGDVLPDRVARRAVDRGQLAVAAHLRQRGEVGARVVVEHLAGPVDGARWHLG